MPRLKPTRRCSAESPSWRPCWSRAGRAFSRRRRRRRCRRELGPTRRCTRGRPPPISSNRLPKRRPPERPPPAPPASAASRRRTGRRRRGRPRRQAPPPAGPWRPPAPTCDTTQRRGPWTRSPAPRPCEQVGPTPRRGGRGRGQRNLSAPMPIRHPSTHRQRMHPITSAANAQPPQANQRPHQGVATPQPRRSPRTRRRCPRPRTRPSSCGRRRRRC
mmetsp:Transcript_75661/g.213122  ORF Transcript_75661/g.213122 Transcript_75661/m.213122 type:complete len:217 (+) Transcript_75661:317-967(+)